MTPQVIDTLLSSGAHISRYLVQCAMHHYYRTAQVPFIKTLWVRSMSLDVFTYFQMAAVRLFGNVPFGKGDDDGAIMEAAIKDSRFPVEQRKVKLESLQEILEKYKFIPFCHRDAMMANFPLVLAIEPSLLPYAQANGFTMDHKYRNFVFRKMFEKPAATFEERTEEIVNNVRELSRLNARMYVSRTVAAEICMEAKQNETAYNALKRLNKEGLLKFDLALVVEDLIKTFSRTRSITFPHLFCVLRQLFQDFPSNDRNVRLVLLLQVFLSESTFTIGPPMGDNPPRNYVDNCAEKIQAINLDPVQRSDLVEVLASKFAPDRFRGVLEYGRVALSMSKAEIEELVQEVAFRCLEVGCKGRMLQRLVELYPSLDDAIRVQVLRKFKLDVGDLPPCHDTRACMMYEAPLCQDFVMPRMSLSERVAELRHQGLGGIQALSIVDAENSLLNEEGRGGLHLRDERDDDDLGRIGQDTLSTMIRKDELGPTRGRRRIYDAYHHYEDMTGGKLTYPADNMMVGKWIRMHYGLRSAVTAVFMIHAILNTNPMVVQPYVSHDQPEPSAHRVPLTLKHFKLLARLGRAPPLAMIDDIEHGTDFYFSEEDYLTLEDLSATPSKKGLKRRYSRASIKIRIAPEVQAEQDTSVTTLRTAEPSSSQPSSSSTKRPRRSAASSTKQYVVPDSDDDMILDDTDKIVVESNRPSKPRKVETSLQKWVKHLTALLQAEQRKVKEQKKLLRAATAPGTKIRVVKNEFVKSMSTALVRLRKVEREKRILLYGIDVPDEEPSSSEEDEYHDRMARPPKRRKIRAE
ncbi:uncharacterized protein PHACADRAFT_265050 [Phanerochaete carnosa HHB-10118-sp]|uniref:Uncharacterized protein n=1 Tax=Phanerochaete carnosa (strain HHB-10118-sp) TaxID=650164 RepID=K5VEE6_PHACS|nr:uncharacterized protein PHACADRAFT_265050 [Phanerochaete carnosa HHB-10118-sp]EKM49523.1 hypothetical protein PHACADRAFT_265050 [Phanerochaete carnosa HHB-10118-sp]